MTLRDPSQSTLDKYGLDLAQWKAYAGDRCRICERSWEGLRAVVDHEHVRGWSEMPPEQRRLYVRGVICAGCNHLRVSRYLTVQYAMNIVQYLKAYDRRKPRGH